MTEPSTSARRLVDRTGVALLAALAYLPAFASAPGKVPADTKLYLYLNPGRLWRDAFWSWDDRQFAGWVPHQTIGYLWPSGPWFWLMQRLGAPDWVAHRLWIGTILFAAGLGARWCAKRFGLPVTGALVAAAVYQLSPFVLPYISRTSVLLLPWAGLGWLLGITMSAAKRGGWRDAALFGLVVATIGGINATAMAMIAPAPVLWVLDAAARRELPWKRAVATLAKLGGAALAVSSWWLVALAVQAKFGAPVLNYSETLQSVSFTSVSTEALRGLGYWLFYVRDVSGPLTSTSLDYQLSTVVMGFGFLVILAGIAGLVMVRWRPRRFLTLSLLAGIVLAVGAHPIGDPSPLGRPLAESATSTLTLALRSSTRAVPLAILALALGAGALVTSLEVVRPRLGHVAAVIVAVLAVLNLPALRHRELVDPVLAHPQEMPVAWTAVADRLDELGTGSRSFQLPGTESAVARWGQTVDPVLPGLTDRDIVQRDWLPLGSAPAMDLFYALDDRFQTDTVEPAAIAPVARWFGADSIVYAGDVAFDKFRTVRPELTWSIYEGRPKGLGSPIAVGDPMVNQPAVPMLDDRALTDDRIGTEVPQTAIVPVEDAAPIVTGRTGETLVVGDGAGLVSAAGAEVLTGDELVRSTAALDDEELSNAAALADQVVLTDSNRKQAHQWRGSQDALGYVERVDEEPLRADDADHRLPVFPDETAADQTVAVADGPITATATSYGEPAALRPEDRPALAVDGDPTTAWRVADRAEPLGERIRLDLGEAREVGAISVVQAQDPGARRRITALDVTTAAGTERVELDQSSMDEGGQSIPIGETTAWIELTVAATDIPVQPNYAGYGPVGLAEVRVDDLRATTELLQLPTRVPDVPASTPFSVVTERWRIDPTNRWRRDPEAALARRFELPTDRSMDPEIQVRLDRRAPDDVIAAVVGLPAGITASSHLAGAPGTSGWAAFDGDPATAWTTEFGGGFGASLSVDLPATTTISSLSGTFETDTIRFAAPTELVVAAGGGERRIEVDPASGGFDADFEPLSGDRFTITVAATTDGFTIDRRFGEPIGLPIAFSEFSFTGAPVVEWPTAIDTGCRDDLLALDGEPIELRVSGTVADAFAGRPLTVERCGNGTGPLTLAGGSHDLVSAAGASTGLDVDRVVLRSGTPRSPGRVPVAVESRGRGERTVRIGPCPDGCWLVTGDGWNAGWRASIDGRSLGEPEAVDGGFNGWYLPAGTDEVTVHVTWTPQRRIWIALVVSLLAVLAAMVIVRRTRRIAAVETLSAPRFAAIQRPEGTRGWSGVVVAGAAAALAIGPMWGLAALVLTAAVTVLRRPAVLGALGWAIVFAVAAFYVHHQRNGRFLPGFGWVVNIESTHRWTLLALVLIAAGAWSERRVAEPPTAAG